MKPLASTVISMTFSRSPYRQLSWLATACQRKKEREKERMKLSCQSQVISMSGARSRYIFRISSVPSHFHVRCQKSIFRISSVPSHFHVRCHNSTKFVSPTSFPCRCRTSQCQVIPTSVPYKLVPEQSLVQYHNSRKIPGNDFFPIIISISLPVTEEQIRDMTRD